MPMNEMIDKRMLQEIEKSRKELNKELKKLFAGQITQNFMLDIMYTMITRYSDLQKYIPAPNDIQSILSGRLQNLFYILCEHIIGVHRSKIIFLSDSERSKLEDDNSYKEELMEDVYKELKLRYQTGVFIREGQIVRGDKFILFPLPYYITILTLKLLEIAPKTKKMPIVYIDIANKSLAILSLLQDNFSDCAYSSCRIIIEDYIRGTIFHNCKEAMEEFYKFSEYELKQSLGYEFDDEFLDKFDNRLNKSCRNKIEFLHYGWVDVIPGYHQIVDKYPYSFGSVKKFIVEKFADVDKNQYDLLDYYHSMCNGYAHGSILNSKYPLLHYFEITSILVNVTVNAYFAACDEIGESTLIDDLDIIAEINKHYKILKDAELKKSTENFENYYKNFKVY